MSPTDVVFLRADSSEELMALEQVNMRKDGILINVEGQRKLIQGQNTASKLGAKKDSKTASSSSNNFNKHKRSTNEGIDKFIENKTKLQKAKFNSTISSVVIGV